MTHPSETLARNVKTLREDRNLSLERLAELTGVSKSMLRQIEIGQSSPTIATIWKIANGLRIPFTALLQEQTQAIHLQSFKDVDPLTGDTTGYRLYPLLAFSPERPFETYYVELDPGTTLDAEPHQGNAEEHLFVFRGAIEITVGEKAFNVTRDNLITFQADCTHRYENKGDEPALAFMLISYAP